MHVGRSLRRSRGAPAASAGWRRGRVAAGSHRVGSAEVTGGGRRVQGARGRAEIARGVPAAGRRRRGADQQ